MVDTNKNLKLNILLRETNTQLGTSQSVKSVLEGAIMKYEAGTQKENIYPPMVDKEERVQYV